MSYCLENQLPNESGASLEKIPFDIRLNAIHGLNSETMTDEKRTFLIAGECATSAKSLFWAFGYICNNESFITDTRTTAAETGESDLLFISLNHLARLGYALTDELALCLEKLEDRARKSEGIAAQ